MNIFVDNPPKNDKLITKGQVYNILHSSHSHELTVSDGFVINFTEKHKYPNAFHRFMQRLFFGFKYKKL